MSIQITNTTKRERQRDNDTETDNWSAITSVIELRQCAIKATSHYGKQY